MKSVLDFAGVVGDGKNDDSAGLQAALDSGACTVLLPQPPKCYLISKTLRIHSGQTLQAERNAVIRLANQANALMLTNADPGRGDRGISVLGGIWDGNNANQTGELFKNGMAWTTPYDPERYIGVIMRFSGVSDLRVAHLTLKDPESFGFQGGNLRRFTVEDITFDYNLLRLCMDGIHLNGNCCQGRIANLKGTTNDDLVALNADEGEIIEMSRGPITDIQIDGIWAENGWTAVRLLSHGSPIRRVKIANIHGTFRYNVVSFTNHKVHPGEASTFDDISIEGIFCSKAPSGGNLWPGLAPIWIDAPAVVSSLGIRDYHRTETAVPADDIFIEAGARIENLALSDVTLVNRSGSPINLLHNHGSIGNLGLFHVHAQAGDAGSGGKIVRNAGTIERVNQFNTATSGFEPGYP